MKCTQSYAIINRLIENSGLHATSMGVVVDGRENTYMKIAMIGHKTIPSREGGVEVVVQNLATRMVRKGHEVVVYNRAKKHAHDHKGKNPKKRTSYKGVTIKEVLTIDKKGLAACSSSFFATISAIFRKYDCIHYHAEGPAAMSWIPHLLGIPVVVTIHGLDWKRAKWGRFASAYLKFGEYVAAKCADEIIVLSENTQQYFQDTYNRETRFVPNGIGKSEHTEPNEITKRWGLKGQDYILYLGRIVPEKCVDLLVDAYKATRIKKKLVIAGASSDTDRYYKELSEAVAEDDRIIMTGFVEGNALRELYSNTLLYCLPSDLEGMPISLLEALSYGNFCLTSDIPECTEITRNYGVSFKNGSLKDLKEKLTLIDSANYKSSYSAKEIQDYISSEFGWDGIVDQTLELYQGACKKHARR